MIETSTFPTTGPTIGNQPRRKATPGFGTILRTFRLRRGISQATLSNYANQDHVTISRLESGEREPSRMGCERLSRALDLKGSDRAMLFLSAGYIPDEMKPIVWAMVRMTEEGEL